MNQQQDSQGSSSQFEDNEEQSTFASPWLIQDKGRTHEGPKSEHPSTYDESTPPLSYRAQDQRQASPSPKIGARPASAQKNFPEVDDLKMAHRPYNQYKGGWQVPYWARTQQNNSGAAWLFVLVALCVLGFPVLYVIITVLIPLIALFFLIVLVILGAFLLAVVIIATLWIIGKLDDMRPPSWW